MTSLTLEHYPGMTEKSLQKIKNILLVVNKGEVTTGHELQVLLSKIPADLQDLLYAHYEAHKSKKGFKTLIQAIIHKSAGPNPPDRMELLNSYVIFQDTIKSVSNIFIRARYFFEEPNDKAFSFIECPSEQIHLVINALAYTYSQLNDPIELEN